MESAASTKASFTIVLPLQYFTSDEDESLADSDLEETELTKEEIEAKKTNTFESVEKDLKILSEIHEHLDTFGYFDDVFIKSTTNLSQNIFAFEKASLKTSNQFKQEYGDLFVKLGGVKIVCDVVMYCHNRGYYDKNHALISEISNPLMHCMSNLLNFTDANPRHCHLLVEHGGYLPYVLGALKRQQPSSCRPEIFMQENITLYIGVVHNIAQSEHCNNELREMGFVDVLLTYLETESVTPFLLTLSTLAELVDDSEARLLETDAHFFELLLKYLKNAIDNRRRRFSGWSARELARIIRRIAKNDINKKSLVAKGSLPVLFSLTNSEHEDEQIEAFEALWMLSFDKDNQNNILNDDAVMEAFIKFRKSHCLKIKNACNGALWNMREKLSAMKKYERLVNEKKDNKQEVASSTSEAKKGHVMISYQWENQTLIQKIRDNLKENGVKCWMDIDDMHGSTVDTMAKAVEGADIVLICYSKKYKESPNCRAEAEYAFQLKKTIIPLKMERNFEAREWLGLIIGAKLYYEFTDKYPFEEKMNGLLKEVLKNHQKSVHQKPVFFETVPDYTEKTSTSSSKPRAKTQVLEVVKNWTESDVLRWINHHKLPSSIFSTMTGMDIAFLQVLRQESPDFFYKALNKMLKLNDVPTMAKFSFALEDTLI